MKPSEQLDMELCWFFPRSTAHLRASSPPRELVRNVHHRLRPLSVQPDVEMHRLSRRFSRAALRPHAFRLFWNLCRSTWLPVAG
jgi:hypothetical protein